MTVSKPERNRRARNVQLIFAGVTAALLTVLVVITALLTPSQLEATDGWEEIPKNSEDLTPWFYKDRRFVRSAETKHPAILSINEALLAKDRDTFLSYAEGDAVEQMALWWDNSTAIGWEFAYMLPSAFWNPAEERAYMHMGAELAFTTTPVRGSGNPDAGLRLTQGFAYEVTTKGAGKDLVITSFEATGADPWQDGPIYAVQNEHSVVYGYEDEADFVDQVAPQVEAAAVEALDKGEELTGVRPLEGFVVAVTDKQDVYDDWTFGFPIDSAGFASPTDRPTQSEYLPGDVATGTDRSGVFIAIAPTDYEEGRYSTLVHEFGHAIHLTAETRGDDAEASEGFASFFQVYTGVSDGRLSADAQQRILAEGYAAFSEDALRDGDDSNRVSHAYAAAETIFSFVYAQGGDPWQLALDSLQIVGDPDDIPQQSLGLIAAFEEMSPEYTEQAWLDWVAAQTPVR